MYLAIGILIWTVFVVIATLVGAYFVVKNNEKWLLQTYAKWLIKSKNLKSNIADIVNSINQIVDTLK
ncbi:MAG: hypothetical protein ACP5JE_03850 [Thermoplasmata archaeon]